MKISTGWDLKNISINKLDDLCRKYNWFPGDLSECHRNSIKQDGIRLPLLVQEVENSKFIIIDGFKRLSWLKYAQGKSIEKFQQEQLPCLIIPSILSSKDVARIRLDTVTGDQKSFSGIHLCKVLNMLCEEGFSEHEIAFEVLPSFGVISSLRLVGQLINLQKKLVIFELKDESKLPESIMIMGYEDLLPLLKFKSTDLYYVTTLADKMEVKGKKWRNLLQVLDEVIRLQETSVAEILYNPEIKKILDDSNIYGPVRYRLLKQKLDALRYPQLNKMRKNFDQNFKYLKLSEQITLESDKYFEKEELALKMKFCSVDELRAHLKILSNSVNSVNLINVWNDFFAILHEE